MTKKRVYKIEKDVPITGVNLSGSKYPFGRMEVGDSFDCGKPDELKRIKNAHKNWARSGDSSIEFEWRLQDDGTVRCWRVK